MSQPVCLLSGPALDNLPQCPGWLLSARDGASQVPPKGVEMVGILKAFIILILMALPSHPHLWPWKPGGASLSGQVLQESRRAMADGGGGQTLCPV